MSIEGPSPFPKDWEKSELSKIGTTRPTVDQARATFSGLGDNDWKQMIDGKYHKFGPMVFDEGLHGRKSEPGFLASLKAGFKFASDSIGEPLTINFYKGLHKTLCAHFMGSEERGIWRTTHCSFEKALEVPKEFELHFNRVRKYIKYFNQDPLEWWHPIPKELEESKIWIENYNHEIYQQEKNWNTYFREHFKSKDLPCFIRVTHSPRLDDGYPAYRFTYQINDSQTIDRLVKQIFNDYTTKMSILNDRLSKCVTDKEVAEIQNEKLILIAEIFQLLEWLHPFKDGQGRTDLVLLGRLLAEEGFNPSILEEPYVSSWSTLDEWKQALIAGMERWKQERAKTIS